MLRSLFQEILDFLFPTKCIVCGVSGKVICESCFSKIPTNPKDNLNILSVYEYKNIIVNSLLWQLKYHHNGDIAKILAKKISLEIRNWLKDFPESLEIIFIPAPLNQHDKRLNNHAELLAKEISKYFPNSKVIADLLEKNSLKKQAHTKNKHERILNLEKSFVISKKFLLAQSDFSKLLNIFFFLNYIFLQRGNILDSIISSERKKLQKEFENKIILIVDDVTTTGATISNIRFVLGEFLEIKEENILGVTVAH